MDTQTILKQFGLSEKEIAVYLSLINLGPSPVRAIAAASKVNRGTTYDILKALKDQGLVSYFNKAAHQYFAAEPPEKLVLAVEQKQKDLENTKKIIESNLPSLKATFEKEGGRPVMKLYEGRDGIKQILSDLLATMRDQPDKTYFVYSSASLRKNVYESMPKFSDQRIKYQIQVKTIALGQGGQVVGLDERKWLKAPGEESTATYELIYGGKVAHISLDKSDNPVGVIIENEGIYETQKLIFQTLWQTL